VYNFYIKNKSLGKKFTFHRFKAEEVLLLKHLSTHKSSKSQAARKFGCVKSYVSKTLKKHTDVPVRHKKIIPNRNKAQKPKRQQLSGRLCRKFVDHEWVIDDESYFNLKHSNINGNDLFYASYIL